MSYVIELLTPGMNPHPLLGDISALYKQLSPGSPDVEFSALSHTIRNSFLFVARTDDRVIGMATLSVAVTLHGKCGHVDDVVVHETHQGHGVGRLLMERVIEHAKNLSVKELNLTSRPSRVRANKLYPRLGFRRRNRETNIYRLIL